LFQKEIGTLEIAPDLCQFSSILIASLQFDLTCRTISDLEKTIDCYGKVQLRCG